MPLALVIISTVLTGASLSGDCARVGSEGLGDAVGLPNVELHAAGAVLACTRVSVLWVRNPALGVGLTVNKFDVMRALGVAVAYTVLGTGLVTFPLIQTAILGHLREVEGSVDSTRKL